LDSIKIPIEIYKSANDEHACNQFEECKIKSIFHAEMQKAKDYAEKINSVKEMDECKFNLKGN